MRELGILHFRVISGKKWSCVNSAIFIFVDILWLLEAQLFTSCVRLIVKVSSDTQCITLELANKRSCGAELAFCSAICWVLGFLVWIQSPTFPGELRRQEMILVWVPFIWSAKWQLLRGFFHTEAVIWDCAILMANMTNIHHELRQVQYLDVEVNLVFVNGIKLLHLAVRCPVCCREEVLGRNSTSFADLLHLWPGRIQASSHWLILI